MSKSKDSSRVEGNPSVAPYAKTFKAIEANPAEYFATVNAVQHDTQRRILYALVQGSGVTDRDEIAEVANVSDRTVRKHTNRLEEHDLVERPDHNTTAVRFASVEARALATHALNVWFKA